MARPRLLAGLFVAVFFLRVLCALGELSGNYFHFICLIFSVKSVKSVAEFYSCIFALICGCIFSPRSLRSRRTKR